MENNFLMKQLEGLKALFGKLSFNQRILIGTLAVGAVLIMVFFYNHSQEDYDVMLSGLDESDAAAVVQNLKTQGVPYHLAEGGTTILVPRSRKEELRLGVFKDDLIKSDKTVGFGALKTLPFGMTDWQQQKYEQKMISDEVVSTLEKIQGIKKARVILAQGQDSLFSTDKIDPTASVMLIVEPGFRLKSEQIKAVRNIVAHSVPGLKPENVTLSDSSGNELTDGTANAQGAITGSEDDNQRSVYEKQKSKDILEMLTALVGPNNAVVKVSAVMNFDKAESKIKRFIPAGGTADSPTGIPGQYSAKFRSVYRKRKRAKTEGGQPGVTANTPTYSEDKAEKDGGKSNYQNTQTTTNYEVSTEEKTIEHAPGTVERMSIAVVVNKVLTDTESKQLTQLVTSASGADVSRGDTVTVSGLQFSPDIQDQQKKSLDLASQSSQKDLILGLVQFGGIFILALAALFIFYKLIKRPVNGELMEDDDDVAVGGYYGEDFNEPALLESGSLPILEARLDPEIEQMRESITAMVNRIRRKPPASWSPT